MVHRYQRNVRESQSQLSDADVNKTFLPDAILNRGDLHFLRSNRLLLTGIWLKALSQIFPLVSKIQGMLETCCSLI